VSPDQVRVILDALEFQETTLLDQFERQPRTRGGKPNPLRAYLQKEIDLVADARIAFKTAKLETVMDIRRRS
jgi:hypothetical protein